jgi:glycosyltransferase involved in cell wall biosynthesis
MAELQHNDEIFFSICIPQYNRTSFLLEALASFNAQTFRNFEVCISDDASSDGRHDEIERYLQQNGMQYRLVRQTTSLRYDANLRAAVALAAGRYCFLMGNDDCLCDRDTLTAMHKDLVENDFPSVAIANFEDWRSGEITRRVTSTKLVGSGAELAVAHYRNVAFVSGVTIDRERAQAIATARWDGSEMYQMYLMARIVATGGRLLTIDRAIVRKDILIPGESVDSYALRPRLQSWPIKEIKPPFVLIGKLVADAISLGVDENRRDGLFGRLFMQLYAFTYPFWIVEYRRVQSWGYALGICFGLRPKNTFSGMGLGFFQELKLRILYVGGCVAGLLLPISWFDRLKPMLYKLAKSRQ